MPASVDFYCGMLGFEVEKRNDDWGWAMLRFDECRLMLDQFTRAASSTDGRVKSKFDHPALVLGD